MANSHRMKRTLLATTVRLLFMAANLGLVAGIVSVLRHDDKNIADVCSAFVVAPIYLLWLFTRDFWKPGLTRDSFLGPIACLCTLCALFYFGLLTMAIRNSATRMSMSNDLKQIGLAMLEYQAKNGSLPPPYTQSPEGKPLLSWRVLLLPYLEQKNLFDQFHQDEPWDSPHNLALLQVEPRIYCRSDLVAPNPGMTFYRVFGGPDTLFAPGKSINIKRDVADPARRAVVFESSQAVDWTKPETLDLETVPSGPRFGATRVADRPLHWTAWRSSTFDCLMADGSVEYLPTDISEADLKKLVDLTARPGRPEPVH